MKAHSYSKYSNNNPPYKDKNWVYNDSRNTVVYNTWLHHGLPYKKIKLAK